MRTYIVIQVRRDSTYECRTTPVREESVALAEVKAQKEGWVIVATLSLHSNWMPED